MTEAVRELDEAQPYESYSQFLGITMKVDNKYAVAYVVVTLLSRTVYAVLNIVKVAPSQECSSQLSFAGLFLFLSVVPQAVFYFKSWHHKFKQFNDRAKVGKELSLIFKLHLAHVLSQAGLRIVLQVLFKLDPFIMNRVRGFLFIGFLNTLLVITIYLPLRWQKQMDAERNIISGLDLKRFLLNAWYRREFGKFLKDDVVLLSFYESITEFRQTIRYMDREERHDQLMKIYKLYISETAPFSMKLKSTTAHINKIEENVRNINNDPDHVDVDGPALDRVAEKLLKTLESEYYPSFITQMYSPGESI
eukprot:183203_1